jgi:hypothetical protein
MTRSKQDRTLIQDYMGITRRIRSLTAVLAPNADQERIDRLVAINHRAQLVLDDIRWLADQISRKEQMPKA